MNRFPAIPPNGDRNPTVEKIRELIQIWKGERGNSLDRVITFRDLVGSNIGSLNKAGLLGTGSAFNPTPIHIGPLTNLTANGGFKIVFLNWDGENQYGYSYTEIFRADTDNLANSILVGTALASLFVDASVNSNQTYYYWVRAVSTSGHKTAFNATAGTAATTVLEPQYVADVLQGMIDSSHLVAELLTPIQSIPSIQTTLDDHNIRLPALEDYVNIIDAKVAAYRDLPDFNQNNAYSIGDIVKYGGIAWRALVNMIAPSATPIEGANWTAIGNYATYDGVLSGNAQAISDLSSSVTDLDGVVTSQASSITSIQASLDDIIISDFDVNQNYAIDAVFRYNNEFYKVIATQTQPNVTPPNATYYVVSPDHTSLQTDVSANAAALSALDTRVVAAEGTITSHSSSLTSLSSSISSLTTDTQTNANAIFDLNTTTTTQAGQITANSNAITLIQSDVTALENADAATATAINQLTTRVTAAEGDIDSQALSITSINSSINAINGDIININGLVSGNAGAISLLDTRVTATEGTITAHSTDITNLQTSITNANTNIAANSSAVSSLNTRVTLTEQDITAIGLDLTTLYANVGDNYAAIQNKAEVSVVAGIDGNVQSILAQQTIKLDVNGRVSGIGLMNDGVTSQFVVASDAVFFIDPGQSVTPFNPATNYASITAARNTQLVFGYALVEGQKRFVINVPAYIQDGTITTAQIMNATINMAQIVDLVVSEAEIADAAITNAKIGNVISSTNYVPGQSGWIINKNGAIEAHNITIYDAQGNVAFQSGYGLVDDNTERQYNPVFSIRDINGKPDGALTVGAWSNNNLGYSTSPGEMDVLIFGSSELTTQTAGVNGVALKAFPIENPDRPYVVKVRYKKATSDNLYIRLGFLTALQMNTGVTHITSEALASINPNPVVQGSPYHHYLRIDSVSSDWVEEEFTVDFAALKASYGLQDDFAYAGLSFFYLNYPHTQSRVDYVSVKQSLGDLAYLDDVTTTYIRDAAITTAKIQNASITSAKIGSAAVDTLKIAGNAVTVLGSTTGTSLVFNHGHSTSIPCFILASMNGTGGEWADDFITGIMEVRLNGAVIGTAYLGAGRNSKKQGVAGVVTAIPIGNNTISIALTTAETSNFKSFDKTFITVTGTKR